MNLECAIGTVSLRKTQSRLNSKKTDQRNTFKITENPRYACGIPVQTLKQIIFQE